MDRAAGLAPPYRRAYCLSPASRAFSTGFALGAAIWLLSEPVTGRQEPWDAAGLYYPASLLAAGLISGLAVPGHLAAAPLGVYAGQAVVLLARVMIEPGDGGLWPLGLLVMAVYSLLAFLGAGLGATLAGRPNRP